MGVEEIYLSKEVNSSEGLVSKLGFDALRPISRNKKVRYRAVVGLKILK